VLRTEVLGFYGSGLEGLGIRVKGLETSGIVLKSRVIVLKTEDLGFYCFWFRVWRV